MAKKRSRKKKGGDERYLYAEVKAKGIRGKKNKTIRVYSWPNHRFMHLLGVPHKHVLMKGKRIIKRRAKMTHRKVRRFRD